MVWTKEYDFGIVFIGALRLNSFYFFSLRHADRFGPEVMETVVSWTKNLCMDISRRHLLNHIGVEKMESNDNEVHDLSSWSVLDLGTGNGLLLQELAKLGY